MLLLHAIFKANANTLHCHTTSGQNGYLIARLEDEIWRFDCLFFQYDSYYTANGVEYFRHKLHAVCQDTQYANNLGRRSADLMSSTYTYTEIETRLIRVKQ